jgi:hypothetical protein
MSRSACIDQNSMKKSQRFWRIRKVNIRTSSLGIDKIIVGITMTFEDTRSRKRIEKMGPIDNILKKTRPCENSLERIVFQMEVNIYNGIIYCPYNRVTISNNVASRLLG